MQDLPDKMSLLHAVAKFLGDERLKKEVRDPGIAFRLKIAAHVVEQVAREDAVEELHDALELSRLEALFDRPAPSQEISRTTCRALIGEHNRLLAQRLRSSDASPSWIDRAHAHLKQTLIEKLSVTTPRFDVAEEIE